MALLSVDPKTVGTWFGNLLRTLIAGAVLGIGAVVYNASNDITIIKVTLVSLDKMTMERNKTVDRRLDTLEDFILSSVRKRGP